MPKLPSSNLIIKVLESQGFTFISQRESHLKFKKIGKPTLIVILPANKKEIPIGTFKSILRQSQLSQNLFI